MRIRHVLSAVLLCGLVSPFVAAEEEYARARLLVEPDVLAKPRTAERFIVLDARTKEAYDASHIPGAHWVDHDVWKAALGDGTDAEGWSKRLGALGIGTDSRVVVYDDVSAKNAARIWWLLRYWGVNGARLLNGGWKTWQAEDLPTRAETTEKPEPVAFEATARRRRLTTKKQILGSLTGRDLQIVDVRSTEEFCGTDKKDNQRGGAIPGAIHLQWSLLVDPETDRFKSPEQLAKLFDQAGIDLDKPAASHCQSGGRASVMVFGLELMGARDARNYYPGWSEWGNDQDVPVIVPEEK